jgi:hypothetical protein
MNTKIEIVLLHSLFYIRYKLFSVFSAVLIMGLSLLYMCYVYEKLHRNGCPLLVTVLKMLRGLFERIFQRAFSLS